jgi:hypothetical protein
MFLRPHLIVTALAFSFSVSAIRSAHAEVIECGSGDVECLIAAIHQANTHHSKTTIRLAGGTYLLTSVDNDTNGLNGLPSITTRITIDAGGATLARVSGAPGFRILHVGPSGDLTLNRATVVNGGRGGQNLFNAGHADILNSVLTGDDAPQNRSVVNDHGTLSIVDSTVVGIRSRSAAGVLANEGGVVHIIRTTFERNEAEVATVYSAGGEVHISESYFKDNEINFGAGGVTVTDGATAIIVRTTFAGNVGDGTGAIRVEHEANLIVRDSALIDNHGVTVGAIFVVSGDPRHPVFRNGGTASVTNTTFASNEASFFCEASAILNGGTLTLVNSTFVDNKLRGDCYKGPSTPLPPVIRGVDTATTVVQNTIVYNSLPLQNCDGVITSLGNNLFSNLNGCNITLQTSDLVGEARLGALTDDGTAGNAHVPLLPDSPAIDAANKAACPKKDQSTSSSATSLRAARFWMPGAARAATPWHLPVVVTL